MQDEFAILFGGFVGDGAERIEEYSSCSFVGLSGFSKCALKFYLGHFEDGLRGRFIARAFDYVGTKASSPKAAEIKRR